MAGLAAPFPAPGGGMPLGRRKSLGVLIGAGVVAALLLFATPAVLLQTCTQPDTIAEGAPDSIDLPALEIATRTYDVAREMRMTERRILSAYITILVESGGGVTMRNEPGGDRDSVGAFQQRNLPEWTKHGRNRLNVRDAARSYFEAVRTYDAPGISPGELATRVQRMDARYAFRYLTPEVLARARQFLAQVKSPRGQQLLASSRAATVQLGAIAAQVVLRRDAAATGPRARAAARPGSVRIDWPTSVKTISSPFGARSSPCPGCSSFHEGLDIGAPHGAPVHAAAAGRVVFQGTLGGYGNYLCLRHQANFATCYAHLSRFAGQAQGSLVRQGQVIGAVGDTGIGTGAHLHFEVRTSGGPADPAVDPAPYLAGAASSPSAGAALAADACGDGATGVGDGDAPTTSGPAAELRGDVVSAPASAPDEVKKMIAAGNAIQRLPYTYGGGHNAGYKPTPGFDCSSTVSFVLWKAGVLKSAPLTSGGLMNWGKPGRGRWVTIYSHAGHTFVVIAGQRLDTSPQRGDANSERGPRWRGTHPRSLAGFTATHPPGL